MRKTQKKPLVSSNILFNLQENFGFIETIDHDQEVFFHFSNFVGNTSALELGHEVEYSLSSRSAINAGNCIPAENVKIIPKGTIPQPKVLPSVYSGIVLRPLRCINPDQLEYCGLVQVRNENDNALSTHEFGITSLKNKRDLLQKDDAVTFKIDEQNRAVEVNQRWLDFVMNFIKTIFYSLAIGHIDPF